MSSRDRCLGSDPKSPPDGAAAAPPALGHAATREQPDRLQAAAGYLPVFTEEWEAR
jgi:hypothetical protein